MQYFQIMAKHDLIVLLIVQRKLNIENVEKYYFVPNSKTLEVYARSMDLLLVEGFSIPHLLKIDVEGVAAEMFKSAVKLLQHHPDIYLELHGPEEQNAIAEFLIPNGYKFKDMRGNCISDPIRDWCSSI